MTTRFEDRLSEDEHFFLFEESSMQAALVARLCSQKIPHQVDEQKRVHYASQDEEAFDDMVCAVRGTFSVEWHLCTWEEDPDTERYRQLLLAWQIPFVMERTDWAVWFLLRAEDKQACEAASEQLWDEAGKLT